MTRVSAVDSPVVEGDRGGPPDPLTVSIPLGSGELLRADLVRGPESRGLVIFAHGSGSGRKSPRNRFVAARLHRVRLATLLLDLLTTEEAREDERSATFRFNIPLLASRLVAALTWAGSRRELASLPVGIYGASTGGAAAMLAASQRPREVAALVLRGARTDLADEVASSLKAPTLLLVGGHDYPVIEINHATLEKLRCDKRMVVVPGATHLFEEPGALDTVADLTRDWLRSHLGGEATRPPEDPVAPLVVGDSSGPAANARLLVPPAPSPGPTTAPSSAPAPAMPTEASLVYGGERESYDLKRADLKGPGIGNYADVARVLPADYHSLLTPRETQQAIFAVKEYIERELCRELGLMMVTVPLIVEAESGINDMLDRDGSRTPVQFHIPNDREQNPVNAQVVQAATKWKRMALKEFSMGRGEGLCTDMRAVRKDYFLDHDHSAYVDQWDWEKVIAEEDRNLEFLKDQVRRIWKVLTGAQKHVQRRFPQLKDPRYPDLPEEIRFFHAEEILDMYPELPRKQRETELVQRYPAVFILGIGWPLSDGLPHEMRAADYDDWSTETSHREGRSTRGLNGDILVWNPVTQRRHELMSGGIRVTPETLRLQVQMAGQPELLQYPYHQAILHGEIPLSIGGGIGQSRTQMLLLRKAHIGEVSVTVWPKVLKEISASKNIHVLE